MQEIATVPFWPHNGTVGGAREPACDEQHHRPSQHANPSKWDSRTQVRDLQRAPLIIPSDHPWQWRPAFGSSALADPPSGRPAIRKMTDSTYLSWITNNSCRTDFLTARVPWDINSGDGRHDFTCRPSRSDHRSTAKFSCKG